MRKVHVPARGLEDWRVLLPSGKHWRQGDSAMALRVFEWTQKLPETWRGSKMALRREILESVTLNRTVSDISFCTEKRKPFDFLAEGHLVQNGTPGRTRTCNLQFRRLSLYPIELRAHPLRIDTASRAFRLTQSPARVKRGTSVVAA